MSGTVPSFDISKVSKTTDDKEEDKSPFNMLENSPIPLCDAPWIMILSFNLYTNIPKIHFGHLRALFSKKCVFHFSALSWNMVARENVLVGMLRLYWKNGHHVSAITFSIVEWISCHESKLNWLKFTPVGKYLEQLKIFFTFTHNCHVFIGFGWGMCRYRTRLTYIQDIKSLSSGTSAKRLSSFS